MTSTKHARNRSEIPALDLIEEAVSLLRRTPLDAYLAYLVGAIPFWLALFFFVSDMTQNAYAPSHVSEAALGMAFMFGWMKCWQTVFAARLRTMLTGRQSLPWTLARVGRMVAIQTFWQPIGLVLRIVAANVIIPYVWVAAFCQNMAILGDGADDGTGRKSIAARAWAQARHCPGQAHRTSLAVSIFIIFVWININAALGFVPGALKMFFGLETAFSRSPESMLNSTFLIIGLGLTIFVVDPLWKAIFAVRCFHGAALRTGEDLLVELRQAGAPPLRSLGAVATIALLCWGFPVQAMDRFCTPLFHPDGARRLSFEYPGRLSFAPSALGRVCKRIEFDRGVPEGRQKLAGGNTPGIANKRRRTPEGCRNHSMAAGFPRPSRAMFPSKRLPGVLPPADFFEPSGFVRRQAWSIYLHALGPGAVSAASDEAQESAPRVDLHAQAGAPAEPALTRKLDDRISEVLERREYAWRAPRENAAGGGGLLAGWMDGGIRALKRIKATFEDAARAFWNAIFGRAARSAPSFSTARAVGTAVLAVAILVAVSALVWLVWRIIKRGRDATSVVSSANAVPDLHSDDVLASQLPEDEWIALARRHAEAGELTLALRAAWLGCLAHLGERELLSIARYKSNRDYERELRRRARAREALLAAFGQNLLAFERAWYGRHEVQVQDYSAFEANLEHIRAC